MFSILFVDDDENLLTSIKRILFKYKNKYNLFYATSAQEGLEILETNHIDLVVSDIKMPQMNGVEFLKKLTILYPNIIRIILSGYSDEEESMNLVNCAHQFLPKPIEPTELINKIERAIFFKELFQKAKLDDIANKLLIIPPFPKILLKIEEKMNNENSSLEEIADLIEQDPVLSLKILQMVNTAFFGINKEINSVKVAVRYLGYNTLKNIILMSKIYNSLDSKNLLIQDFFMKIFRHSLLVAELMEYIYKNFDKSKKEIDEAYTLGILHDIGKLVLLINFKDNYFNLYTIMRKEKINFSKIENEYFGTSSEKVSAFILGIYGISDDFTNILLNFKNQPIEDTDPNLNNLLKFADIYVSESFDEMNFYENNDLDKTNPLIENYYKIANHFKENHL